MTLLMTLRHDDFFAWPVMWRVTTAIRNGDWCAGHVVAVKVGQVTRPA